MSPNKYNAKKVVYNGITFDSKREYERYLLLLDDMRSGYIKDLDVHPKFELYVEDQLICSYKPDFVYTDIRNKTLKCVVEDVKGGKATQTSTWRLKWKLMQALYPEFTYEVVT